MNGSNTKWHVKFPNGASITYDKRADAMAYRESGQVFRWRYLWRLVTRAGVTEEIWFKEKPRLLYREGKLVRVKFIARITHSPGVKSLGQVGYEAWFRDQTDWVWVNESPGYRKKYQDEADAICNEVRSRVALRLEEDGYMQAADAVRCYGVG